MKDTLCVCMYMCARMHAHVPISACVDLLKNLQESQTNIERLSQDKSTHDNCQSLPPPKCRPIFLFLTSNPTLCSSFSLSHTFLAQ